MSSCDEGEERIITVNIAGQVYRVRIREQKIRDRPYITVALHLNLNKSQDLEIARFLEELTREFKAKSGSELLKQIILDYGRLRQETSNLSELERLRSEVERLTKENLTLKHEVEKLREEVGEFTIRPVWLPVKYGFKVRIRGPRIVLDVLDKVRRVLSESGLVDQMKTILYELHREGIIEILD